MRDYPRWEDFEEHWDNSGDPYGKFLDLALEYEDAKKLVSGSPVPQLDQHTREVLDAIRSQSHPDLAPIPLSEAFDRFINERKQNWKDRNTENDYRHGIFALFHELVGDVSTGDLRKQHVIAYKQAVLKLPANRHKLPKYRDLTVTQLLETEIPEAEQISVRTKQKYLQKLSGFLQWLEQHDHAPQHIHVPLQKVLYNRSIAHEERNKYGCEDLRKLFNSRHYRMGQHRQPSHFWVPLIALFTGARLNEICQLHLADIYEYEKTGIWVFDINQDDTATTLKSLKKGEHGRLVPIHPQLKKLGLLEFWEHLNQKREKRLFPELPYHEKNKYGYQMQKWFNGTYTNKNNCDIRTPNTSFHSLRHTFETILANKVEMPVHKLEMMMGQKPSGGVSTGRYIKPIDLEERYTAYRHKLRVPHVDSDKTSSTCCI